jgi:hypothetical protein
MKPRDSQCSSYRIQEQTNGEYVSTAIECY